MFLVAPPSPAPRHGGVAGRKARDSLDGFPLLCSPIWPPNRSVRRRGRYLASGRKWVGGSLARARRPGASCRSPLCSFFLLVDRSAFARADPPSYEAICLPFFFCPVARRLGAAGRATPVAPALSVPPSFFIGCRLLSCKASLGAIPLAALAVRPPFRCPHPKSRAADGGSFPVPCLFSFLFFLVHTPAPYFLFAGWFTSFFFGASSFLRRCSTTAPADSAAAAMRIEKEKLCVMTGQDRETAPQGPTTCDRGTFPAAQGGKIERATVGTRRATGIHQKKSKKKSKKKVKKKRAVDVIAWRMGTLPLFFRAAFVALFVLLRCLASLFIIVALSAALRLCRVIFFPAAARRSSLIALFFSSLMAAINAAGKNPYPLRNW